MIVKLRDFGKYDFISNIEAELAGKSSQRHSTALSFSINGNDSLIYRFPIDENFMEIGFGTIHSKLKAFEKFKISMAVYTTNLTPIVIINKIESIN